MILPGTTYRAKAGLKLQATLHLNQSSSSGFDVILPEGKDFKISLWADPADPVVVLDVKDAEKYVLESAKNNFPALPLSQAYHISAAHDVIENDCILITDFAQAIYFYSALEQFGELSNFALFGFEYENHYYPTVEHFYQSQKFMDQDYAALIRHASTPKAAADLGKNKDKALKADWASIKSEVMMTAVLQKFNTHESLKQLLLSTGDQLIIENSPYDNYWGIGSVGTGRNQLGTILMRVREQLNNK